jgi:hypothetical protein
MRVGDPEAELACAPGDGLVGVDASGRNPGDRLNAVGADGFDLEVEIEREVEAAFDGGVDEGGLVDGH